MTPLVSIIVVNWNAGEYLKNCIKSLIDQTYQNFEIILVDNASTDNSIQYVEKNFPTVQIIKNKENVGFAKGNNIGISISKGDMIALFNPDAIADKEWLSNLVSVLQGSKKIGAAAGKIFYLGDEFGKDAVFCTWSKIDPYTAVPYNFFDDEPSSKVDYLSGAAMLVKKEVIQRVGKLDTSYFLYFDETDWCARMIRAGYDLVYAPKAIAWHKVSASVSDSEKKTYYIERSRVRFASKNFDFAYLFFFYPSFLAESLFIFFRDIKNWNFLRTKIRSRVISWNLLNMKNIFQDRWKDMNYLKKNGSIKSYNKSIPLRKTKVTKS